MDYIASSMSDAEITITILKKRLSAQSGFAPRKLRQTFPDYSFWSQLLKRLAVLDHTYLEFKAVLFLTIFFHDSVYFIFLS
jgi:hypothetical protein